MVCSPSHGTVVSPCIVRAPTACSNQHAHVHGRYFCPHTTRTSYSHQRNKHDVRVYTVQEYSSAVQQVGLHRFLPSIVPSIVSLNGAISTLRWQLHYDITISREHGSPELSPHIIHANRLRTKTRFAVYGCPSF